jgi:hypothetical protein
MSRHGGPRGDRAQRSSPPENRDLQTEIEDEMEASGRSHYVPREGLVGAHQERRSGAGDESLDGRQAPGGHGSEVAPTRKAEVRESVRHQLEHQVGRQAAGELDSLLRQRRGPHAIREALDGIAAEADELVARLRLSAEGQQASFIRRARDWLWERRTGVAIGAGAAALAIGGLALARRSR